jgi:hypothetical protein
MKSKLKKKKKKKKSEKSPLPKRKKEKKKTSNENALGVHWSEGTVMRPDQSPLAPSGGPQGPVSQHIPC